MKIYIDIDLVTNGNFNLKLENNFQKELLYKNGRYHISHTFNSGNYHEEEMTKDFAKDFLKMILFGLKFQYKEYQLIDETFHFFDDAIKKLDSMEIRDYYVAHMNGEYDESRIEIEVF